MDSLKGSFGYIFRQSSLLKITVFRCSDLSMRKFSFMIPSIRQAFVSSNWRQMPPKPRRYCLFQTNRFLFSLETADQDTRLLPSQRNAFLSSNNQQYAYYSSLENSVRGPALSKSCEIKGRNRVEVKIISEQKIKPAFPTPHEWKTYKISILDQLSPNTYLPIVYFFPNNLQNPQLNINELTSKRRQLLKQSLSETLTSFYPLAGKIQNNLNIQCNDDGLYYVEAQVNDHLSSFLKRPDHKLMLDMLPFHPNSVELMFKRCVAMVQVNIFDCGGIAIGLYTSQKIMDNLSHITFLRAWAQRASGCSKLEISPSYISPTLFLQNPDLPEDASFLMRPTLLEDSKCLTKRLLFDSSSLILLKEKADATLLSIPEESSSVIIVTGLIWKCAMKATEEQWGVKRPSVLSLDINLRARNSPPLPAYAIGNISWSTVAQYSMSNDDRELKSIVAKLQVASDEINGDFVERIKGTKGSLRVCELLNEFREMYRNQKAEHLAVSSLCNGGIYEPDFGWGKPTLVSFANANANARNPGLSNRVVLMDTRFGNGIEAWVTLSQQHMAIFERDPELRHFASLLPN